MFFIQHPVSVPYSDVIKAEFWVVNQFERLDVPNKSLRVHMAGYPSQVEYEKGKTQIAGTVIELYSDKFPFASYDDISTQKLCAKLVNEDFFKGGQVLEYTPTQQ